MMRKTTMRKAVCLVLALLFAMGLCLPAFCEETIEFDEDTLASWPFSDEAPEPYVSVMDREEAVIYSSADNVVTFMTGPMSYGPVTNEEEAAAAAYDFVSGTGLGMQLLRADSFIGVNCYTFQVTEGDYLLRNCYVKVIANEEGVVWGIASSLPEDPDSVQREYPEEELRPQENLNAEYESGTLEMTIEAHSGESLEISVPILTGPEDGARYLGDFERRIYCVDASTLESADGESPVIQPLCLENLYSLGPVVTYYRFLQVYDYYAGKGWTGPDGNASPCLLIIDFTGEQDGNAFYGGFQEGFHYFAFGTEDYASQSIQVIAHEFMHGVSATNHIGRYANETGALDEALSDLIGTAVEADIRGWTMEEERWIQSFKRSHRDGYPMYVWDAYYTPSTDTPDQSVNDQGSVHHNANIVSMLAYRQEDAGMTPADRFDYWFVFDLTLTPATDFPEVAARAAWCAEIAGLSDYAPIMKQAVQDLGLQDRDIPDEARLEHQALVRFDMAWRESDLPGVVTFYNVRTEHDFSTWPAAGTNTAAAVLSEGEYIVSITVHSDPEACFLWNGEDWQACAKEDIEKAREAADEPCRVVFERGGVYALGDFVE